MNPEARLRISQAWDGRFDLPTIPIHNNPWIYMAYCFRICNEYGVDEFRLRFKDRIETYYAKCLVNRETPGLFYRWPNGFGGDSSHDELMGGAWLSPMIARDILAHLEKTDGQYTVDPKYIVGTYDETKNVNRFFWLRPFLRACAGFRVSLFSQLLWSIQALVSCWNFTGDASGVLKVWVMCDVMKKYPISSIAVWYFDYRLRNKFKVTPKDIFARNYLTEIPVLADIAPTTWK